jgi:hypothetical protein
MITACRGTAAGIAAMVLIVVATFGAAASASATARAPFNSSGAILKWVDGYRYRPQPAGLPALVRALSEMGAFRDTEGAGAYVGFISGVLGGNPTRAQYLIARTLEVAPSDHWVLVRAIAYSGLPNWKYLLRFFAGRMPTRRVMINDYLDGKLPTLDQIAYPSPKRGWFDKIGAAFRFGAAKKRVALQPSPQLIDVLWGNYLATGSYQPVAKIIKFLPLADDHDSVNNLTTGSAAKFTLASNAVRDQHLLTTLEWAARAKQPKETAAALKDVIETAETVDTTRMRSESLAAIERLKRDGPQSKRELAGVSQIGEGALSVGCIVAAVAGQVELGVPCVIGGAAYSAGMQYLSH